MARSPGLRLRGSGVSMLPLADSWYMGANIPGKHRQLLNYPGLQEYLAFCRESAENGYSGFKLS